MTIGDIFVDSGTPSADDKTDDATKKKFRIDIFRLLRAADAKQRGFYASLTEEEQKSFSDSAWTAMRWLSGSKDVPKRCLLLTNEYVNRHFSALRNHPELQWLLMTATGNGNPVKHAWVKPAARGKDNKVEAFIREWYPSINADEMAIFFAQSPAEFDEFVRATGVTEEEAKALNADFARLN